MARNTRMWFVSCVVAVLTENWAETARSLAVVVSSVVGYLLLIGLTLAITEIPAVLNARDANGNDIPAVIAILTGALGERVGAMWNGLKDFF